MRRSFEVKEEQFQVLGSYGGYQLEHYNGERWEVVAPYGEVERLKEMKACAENWLAWRMAICGF